MDHNIEWGKLYFLTASSKGLAVIILTWNSITSFHCSCVLFMFLCKRLFTVHVLVKSFFTVYVLVNFSFTVYVLVNFQLGLTLSNFSLTAKIRCNINSTIRRVCYISKENFRKSVSKTILLLKWRVTESRVYGRVVWIRF